MYSGRNTKLPKLGLHMCLQEKQHLVGIVRDGVIICEQAEAQWNGKEKFIPMSLPEGLTSCVRAETLHR